MSLNSGTVIIVGALRRSLDDNRIGGQAFACRSLADGLSQRGWTVVEIDSSMKTITARGGWSRLLPAARRFVNFLVSCVRDRPQGALIFSSYGLSFFEKGLMVISARALGIRAVLLPRSGHLQKQLDGNRVFRLFGRVVVGSATFVVCQSTSWRDYFARLGGGRGQYVVIENWLPKRAFIEPSAPVSGACAQDVLVGFYSRVEESKGIFEFLESVRLARSTCSRVVGVIYGDGSCVPKVKEWINGNPGASEYMRYGGWLGSAHKRTALRELDIMLFASHAEGYPNAVLEVLALKVPVVSVRVGAVEDVLEDGVSGTLVDIGDVDALARGIVMLAENHEKRRQYSECAYARALRANDHDVALDRFEGLIA